MTGRMAPGWPVQPAVRDYFRFAFLRHPWHRARSFYADKHALARAYRNAYRWFIAPWYGLRRGMSFAELCRWLGTACGSDAFADRHWLSQHRQLNDADGRQPDFLGRYETLDADWRRVSERLQMPFVELPRLNARVHRVLGPECYVRAGHSIVSHGRSITSLDSPCSEVVADEHLDRPLAVGVSHPHLLN